jgi:hypothetical protein
MKLNRNYITPFISLVFLVVGLSGLLMFFHLFDGYTEVVHEILGLFFIVCAIAHIIINWTALRVHFKKGVFIPALIGVLIISASLIVSESMHPPVDALIINNIVKAPINDAFRALNVDYKITAEKLKEHGISIQKANTIEDIWMNNDADPEEVIDLILE